MVPTSAYFFRKTPSSAFTNHKWTFKSCLHVKMWMLACPQNLFWRGMMSSKDPKILLTVKIFADKQTKFRCQIFLTCLWVYWGNSQLQIVPLLSWSPSSNHNHVSVFIAQRSNNIHCSLITVSCYHSPSWHPRILDTVLQLLLTPALADTCVVWNIDVNILWRRQIKFIVCIFNPILEHLVTEGRWLLLLKVYNVKLEWSFQFPWVTIFLGYW